jgi:8-oxo-dGTP pyrophosphatase MutT (NUDIX family)
MDKDYINFGKDNPPVLSSSLGDDGRAGLAAALRAYRPPFGPQAEAVEEIVAFVLDEPACFQRSHRSGHITGSAWIVDRAGESALLIAHRKLGRRLQPGGHADGESDVFAVALREAQEETGLADLRPAGGDIYDVDVHRIPDRPGEPAHLHYDVRYAFFADPGAPLAPSDETHGAAWVPLAAIVATGADESVLRMARKTPELIASLRRLKTLG